MKTIHLSKKQSDKIGFVMVGAVVLLVLGLLVGFILSMLEIEVPLLCLVLEVTLLILLYIFLETIDRKKRTVYLTTDLVTVYETFKEDYWLAVSYKKRSTKDETIYDVVYFDEEKQVLTESLTEKRFLEKIGEGSTHYKTVKRNCTFYIRADEVKGIRCWLKTPWLCIEEEVIVPFSSIYAYYHGNRGICVIGEELMDTIFPARYGSEAVKPFEADYLDYIKENLLQHIAAAMNSFRFFKSNGFEVNAIVLSEKNFKTRSQVEPNLIKNVENSK